MQKIIKKRKSLDEDIKYNVCLEDMYNIVQRIHISIGHGGRDKMVKEANKKYANISSEALELFKELCEECQPKKRRTASKGIVLCVKNLHPMHIHVVTVKTLFMQFVVK